MRGVVLSVGFLAILCLSATWAPAAEPARSAEQWAAQQWLKEFSQKWDDSAWIQRRRGAGYMRADADAGWQVRMRALQGLVAGGPKSVAPLVETLQNGDEPQRILAAQALSYLAPHAPTNALLKAAKTDKHAAVRLYAVDALGMQGGATKIDWNALLDVERNRDVRKHIGYAQERADKPLARSVVQSLVKWDAKTLNTAAVGKPAPDFELTSLNGRRVRLSDFRGKQAVVLVFVYGDT